MRDRTKIGGAHGGTPGYPISWFVRLERGDQVYRGAGPAVYHKRCNAQVELVPAQFPAERCQPVEISVIQQRHPHLWNRNLVDGGSSRIVVVSVTSLLQVPAKYRGIGVEQVLENRRRIAWRIRGGFKLEIWVGRPELRVTGAYEDRVPIHGRDSHLVCPVGPAPILPRACRIARGPHRATEVCRRAPLA